MIELLAAFALGFLCGGVPDQVKQYFYRKHLEALADGMDEPLNELAVEVEDPDDRAEREKKEEEEYRFFG